MAEKLALLCTIHGRVQGVGYRAWARKNGQKLGLSGWVRNLSDGTVELLLYGPADALHEMLAHCHTGPLAARVTHIDQRIWDGPPPPEGSLTQLATE